MMASNDSVTVEKVKTTTISSENLVMNWQFFK